MNKKNLYRLFAISCISLCVNAEYVFAMEAVDSGEQEPRRQISAPPAILDDADHREWDKLDIAKGHTDPTSLDKKFEAKWLPEENFRRIFGPFIEEFDRLSTSLSQALKVRTDKADSLPLQDDPVSSTAHSQSTLLDDPTIAPILERMKAVQSNLNDALRPIFGFERDEHRAWATNAWYVSKENLDRQAAELRDQITILDKSISVSHSFGQHDMETKQLEMKKLMQSAVVSLGLLYDQVQHSSDYESFSYWKYYKPKDPNHVVLVVTPLTIGVYEDALRVLDLMSRKAGELRQEDSFDLSYYHPMFTNGPTINEMHALFPATISSDE